MNSSQTYTTALVIGLVANCAAKWSA